MTRITKYDLVTEIMRAYDDLDACMCENVELKRMLKLRTAPPSGSDEGGGNALSAADITCLSVGRKKVFDDGVHTWREVKASRNEETGAIAVTPFEEFRKSAFSSCPASMSKNEFLGYFDSEFHAMYERQKEQAIEELKREEADND